MNPPSSPLSPAQAQAALAAIGADQARSSMLFRYRQSAPLFWLWSLVWLCGYGLSGILEGCDGYIWLAADSVGILGSALLLRRMRASRALQLSWRTGAVSLVVGAFIGATLLLMAPLSGRQIGAFFPLVVATAYGLAGIWFGWRVALTGLALALLTLAAFFWAGPYFNMAMAIGGAGAMALAAIWLQRV